MRERSNPPSSIRDDPFSDVLKLTAAQSVAAGGFVIGGAWALRFPAPTKIKFFGVVKGQCWLRVAGEKSPVQLNAGDVFLLSARRSFVLASDLTTIPVDALPLFEGREEAMMKLAKREDCVVIGGYVQFGSPSGQILLDALPSLIVVPDSTSQATILHFILEQLVRERVEDLPGASVVSSQFGLLLFIQVLRAYLESSSPISAGWLRAVGDKRLAPALQRMHSDPARAWQLGELAKACGMSRTTFALYFKAVAGVAPIAYLTRWRMHLAERALRDDDTCLAELARSLGYGSESAFSNAFKRMTGSAPTHFRDTARGKDE
ncbi:AraC family transcriptional regulator [Pendulispora rubella]